MAPTLLLLYGTLALCAGLLGWLVVRYDLHQREPLRLMLVAAALGAVGMHLAGRAQLATIGWMHGHVITNTNNREAAHGYLRSATAKPAELWLINANGSAQLLDKVPLV